MLLQFHVTKFTIPAGGNGINHNLQCCSATYMVKFISKYHFRYEELLYGDSLMLQNPENDEKAAARNEAFVASV